MAFIRKTEVTYKHTFDPKTKRHRINNIQSVLHCHHYTSLYTQLAIDAGETDLLKKCAYESFKNMLVHYFAANTDLVSIQEKTEIAAQYYSLLGLGKMNVTFLGRESGLVELITSHTDEGWKKKWGTYDKPINYITAGFIEAMCETVLDMPVNSFTAVERQSIVCGAEKSIFKVVRR